MDDVNEGPQGRSEEAVEIGGCGNLETSMNVEVNDSTSQGMGRTGSSRWMRSGLGCGAKDAVSIPS